LHTSASAPIVQAAPPAHTAIINGKRTFVVNGKAYERISMLGRGGSSKVYSVLCQQTRSMFAMKRVMLDRADHETIQSYTNEIELLRRLNGHDRIIKLIDYQVTYGNNNRPKALQMVLECGEIDFALLLDEQRGLPLNMNFVGMYWGQVGLGLCFGVRRVRRGKNEAEEVEIEIERLRG
jgi:serine/threonine-protein kinase TTK/MPS1